jgi:hypothetical protein
MLTAFIEISFKLQSAKSKTVGPAPERHEPSSPGVLSGSSFKISSSPGIKVVRYLQFNY